MMCCRTMEASKLKRATMESSKTKSSTIPSQPVLPVTSEQVVIPAPTGRYLQSCHHCKCMRDFSYHFYTLQAYNKRLPLS